MQKYEVSDFCFLKIRPMWEYFKSEHFSFWMICCYLFFEYARPQALFPAIDLLPWAQLFLIGSLLGAVLDKSVKWVPNVANIFITILAIAIFFSSRLAYYPEISSDHYIDFYSWYIVYFLIILIVNTRTRFYVFTVIFIICAAKIAIGTSKSWVLRGFGFTPWGLMGPKGYFQNSGELAILMLTLFPVAYKLYEAYKTQANKLEKLVLIVVWVAPVLTIMGASSRGAQLALVVVLAVMFRKSVLKIKPLIIVAIILGTLYVILPEEQKDRFSSAGEDKTSQQRLLYWTHGWEMIQQHPILGVGYFNFPKYYETYYSQDMLYKKAQLPHNIFIQVGTDAGVLGVIPFISIISYCLYSGIRVRKYEKDKILVNLIVGMSYGILGYVIAGQFVTVAYYPFLWIGTAFIVAGRSVIERSVKTIA